LLPGSQGDLQQKVHLTHKEELHMLTCEGTHTTHKAFRLVHKSSWHFCIDSSAVSPPTAQAEVSALGGFDGPERQQHEGRHLLRHFTFKICGNEV